jgi:hypothetical protein
VSLHAPGIDHGATPTTIIPPVIAANVVGRPRDQPWRDADGNHSPAGATVGAQYPAGGCPERRFPGDRYQRRYEQTRRWMTTGS